MSLILDALNRSESERRGSGDIPGLATEHFNESAGESRRLVGYLPWLALALAVAIIGWLLLDRAGSSEEPVSATTPDRTSAPATAAPVASQKVQPVSAAQSPPPLPVVAKPQAAPANKVAAVKSNTVGERETSTGSPADPAVTALYQQAPAASGDNVEAEAADRAVADRSPEPRSTAEGRKPTAAAPATQPESEPLDIEAALLSAQKEMENARLEEHPAPFIEDLSQQRKDAIPTLMYSIHNFSGKAGQSSVMINGKSLRPGGNVGKGVRLEEILPESIVLSYQGEQFRLRALNSWVNL